MSSKKMKKLPASPPWSDFPSDVLKWIKKNAKPKAALKLMQICKYFQHQEFPFFVVKKLILGNGWRYRTLPGYPLKPKNYVTGKFCDQPFDVWVAESLSLAMSSWSKVLYDDCWGQMLPKLAVHDVKCLSFDHVSITFREFKVLNDGGKVSSLNLKSAFIRDESHEIVPLENLFECLPNLKDLEISHDANTIISHKKATKKMPQELRSFKILCFNDNFKMDECFRFIQKNQDIKFTVKCDPSQPFKITPPTVRNLQTLTDDLITKWLLEFYPPDISFTSRHLKQSEESKERLDNLKEQYHRYWEYLVDSHMGKVRDRGEFFSI